MKKNLGNVAFNGLKWMTLGTIGRSLSQILQIAILTRFLPKESFGLVAMALFVINFTNLFVDMGFTSAIIHRQNISDKEYSSIYWFNIFISLVLVIILYLSASIISSFYNQSELSNVIRILSLNIIFLAIGRLHRTTLQKEFKFKQINIVDIISSFFGLLIAIILALINFKIYSLVYSTLSISLIASTSFIVLNLKDHPIKLHFRHKELNPFIKIGFFSMGSKIISYLSTDIDILIVGKFFGPSSLGLYSLSKQLVIKIFAVINPIITNILSPLLSYIQNDTKQVRSYFLKVTSILSITNLPIYVLVAIFSSEILTIVYGPDYIEANSILALLCFVYFINSINNPIGSLHIATGRTDLGFFWAVLSLVITPISIYFAALTSIDAVAYTKAILTLIMIFPFWLIQLRPITDIKFVDYIMQFINQIIFFIIVLVLVILVGNSFITTRHILLTIIVKLFLTITLFVSYIYLTDKRIYINTFKYI